MKIVRNLDQDKTKRLESLLDREPELIKMLEEFEARNVATSTLKTIGTIGTILLVIVIIMLGGQL